jgi:hypothetical protein
MNIQEHKLNMSFNYLLILAMLIALGVAGRLLPHPPNFTPMAAIALFAGFLFLKKIYGCNCSCCNDAPN